ncbi:hypothetical protein Goari_014930 [Gossypium aridum]|uniref:DUF4283 domain-containing protein n=1 Tax=Gossypium aridum TaxID=34290 RepID=A0A7J8XJ99_GOSAI|nr:hypothetical protein [Gossypium aridum]
MEQTLLSLWCSLRGANIKPIGGNGFYLIQFFHVVNLKMMISGGLWSFNNCFLSVHKLMQVIPAAGNYLILWKGCLSRVGRKRCVRRFDIETEGSQSIGIAMGELGE